MLQLSSKDEGLKDLSLTDYVHAQSGLFGNRTTRIGGLFGNGTTRNGPGLHACILEHDLDLSSVSVSQQVVDVWGLLSLIDCVAAGLYLDSDERGARHSAAYLEPSNNNTIRRSAQLVPLNSQLLAFSVCNDCPPPADNKLDSPCLFVEQPVAFGVPRPLNPSKHA